MFNVSWLLIVTSQDAIVAWSVVAVHLALHTGLMGRGSGELRFVLLLSAVGLLIDQLLFATAVLVLPGSGTLAPLWLTALWPVLATTALHAFSGLRQHLWLAALVGAVGGFGSYRLGAMLSPVDLGAMPYSALALGLLWAGLFPAMLLLAQRCLVPGSSRGDSRVSC